MSDDRFTLLVDGKPYTLRPSEVSASLAGEFRRATGLSVRSLLQMAGEDMDLDVIAGFVWLARRQAGEKIIYAVVADSITYETEIDTDAEPEPEDADSPEA